MQGGCSQGVDSSSIRDFFVAFQASPDKTPHRFDEVVEKDHGRLEVRRCYVFDQVNCLHAPERWPDLKSFVVIASERTIKGKTTLEHRSYITSLSADAARLNRAVRQHWRVENSLHWCMDAVPAAPPASRETSFFVLVPVLCPICASATEVRQRHGGTQFGQSCALPLSDRQSLSEVRRCPSMVVRYMIE